MLEHIEGLPDGLIGVRATGKITGQDYDEVLEPLLAHARRTGQRVRLLYHVAPAFESFAPGAAWADMQVGLRYFWLFERCAVVTDKAWLRRATHALFPCPLKVFHDAEWNAAIGWLSAPADPKNFNYQLLEDREVLVVEPHGKLTAESFDVLAATIDPWLASGRGLHGMVVHAREFPGWESIGSFLRHVHFVREHHRKIPRVALCVDGALAKLAPPLVEIFVAAEIRHFEYSQLDQAIDWAALSRVPPA
ncbi:MAG: STAS/SEC14 domain-containing protein [Gammaproteobacteria bacterium]